MKRKKTLIITIIITVILLFTVGITYAIFNYTRAGINNSQLIVGDIYMHYKENNSINLTDAMPGDEYDLNSYFEFTIDGKNTYTENDIWYDVILSHGDIPDGKTENNRIPDEYLKFRLVEVIDGVETELLTDETYDDLTNERIYVATIPKNTQTEITRTYRLYMAISENLIIGNTADAIYSIDEWVNAFASIKVNVTGDFNEKVVATNFVKKVKSTYGEEGGVIAVNTDGELYDANDPTETIREYRYSGASVNNYVTYNNETWRIIGVFSEELEDGTTEEFVKIVRNDVLLAGSIPTSYYIAENDTTYNVGSSTTSRDAYWNYKVSGTNNNDWTTAGLMYYLNTVEDDSETPNAGYLSTLSSGARNLIRETTYYLGNVTYNTSTKIAYDAERSETIHSGNQTSWRGTVALMYPSDYGYSASNSYWNVSIGSSGYNTAQEDGIYPRSTSWMYETMTSAKTNSSWLLAPSSSRSNYAMGWYTAGSVGSSRVYDYNGVRPALNLISKAKITTGDGTLTSPYVLPY